MKLSRILVCYKTVSMSPSPRRGKVRPTVPRAIADIVCNKSRRRCCLCFAYHFKNEPETFGQIAHLDRNRANNDELNLAYLCIPHHSAYDSNTSQHRNFSIGEVKQARSELYGYVEKMVLS